MLVILQIDASEIDSLRYYYRYVGIYHCFLYAYLRLKQVSRRMEPVNPIL